MLQELTLIGNLGNDPEMRYTPAGKAVCNFSLATNRKWNDPNGQEVQETTWFRVSTWGRQAEVCNQYLTKGRRVFVRGRLNPDAATGGPRVYNRQDGTTGASFEVTAEFVKFLDSNGEGNGNGNGNQQQAPAARNANAIPEDVTPW